MSMYVQHQTGKLLLPPSYPLRIVSLVPSVTELLFDLGLTDEVVGITKFCVHPPEWFESKTRIGGTKTVSIEKVKALQPHLILANKEENVKEQIDELAKYFQVYVSDIVTIDDAFEMITNTGILTNRATKANELVQQIDESFKHLKIQQPIRALYLIWQKPYMSIGCDTFINSMLQKAGFSNVLAEAKRYPEVTVEEIKALNPEVILLSSEPFPFKQKHIDALKEFTGIEKIVLVDGEIFSWYGSRMLKAATYFRHLKQQI